MRPASTYATALLALCLFGLATGLALADVQGGDAFRVVGLNGSQTLPLMNGPASWSGVEADVPFDARNLRATGVRQGNWLQVSYRIEAGADLTGWANVQFLSADRDYQPTVYRVIAGRGTPVPLLDQDSYGVRAYIPGATAELPACGPCQNGYCQVRFQTNRGSIEGFVAQGYLTIPRPAYPEFAAVRQTGPVDAYAGAQAVADDVIGPQDYVQDYADAAQPPRRADTNVHHWQHRFHRYEY